jgi:UDP-N-acetyl-D-mannosaminuronate dehydrogenase
MTVQISVIGLGQVGASIGLALAEYKEKFSGSDMILMEIV